MRRIMLSVAGLAGLALLAHFSSAGEDKKAGDKKANVREIDVKGVSFMREGGSVKKPLALEKLDDLKTLEGAKDLQERVQKGVDFDKEFALVFAWSGSGMDRLALGDVAKDKVVFNYSPGLTRDLRHHLKVFVLPRGATFAVETVRIKIGR